MNKKAITILNIFLLLYGQLSFARTGGKKNYDINELVLPAEVQKLNKRAGSIFYSKSSKDKVLIPTHFWGAVKQSGLHFVPTNTSLIKGISMAGGPTETAKLSNVQVTRKESGGQLNKYRFDLVEGGNLDSHKFELKPGDTVFIEKDHFRENRVYYTSLVSVAVSILSGFIIYRQVKD